MSWWCFVDICIFFFKQNTAYEMRISDWSSDVCSSDLASPDRVHRHGNGHCVRPASIRDARASAAPRPRRRRRSRRQRLQPVVADLYAAQLAADHVARAPLQVTADPVDLLADLQTILRKHGRERIGVASEREQAWIEDRQPGNGGALLLQGCGDRKSVV